jgi:recombination protein RecT
VSATEDTRAALARTAAPTPERNILALLDRMAPEVEKALPAMMDAERFTRVVTTELRRNPSLFECSPESLLGAMMLSAQLGLEPGPLGHVYLVPYKRQVEFIIGYKGLVALAYRSGMLKDVQALTVHEGDHFEMERRTKWHIVHRQAPPADRGAAVCWYAVANLVGGGTVANRLWPEEVEARRKRSAAGRVGKGPWESDYDAMARKSVIRSMAPYLPLTGTIGRAFAVDEIVIPDVRPAEVEGLAAVSLEAGAGS